jgi:hypothetical protein
LVDPADDHDTLELKRGFVIDQHQRVLTSVLHLSAIQAHRIVGASVEAADLEQAGGSERLPQERIVRCREDEILSRTVPEIPE